MVDLEAAKAEILEWVSEAIMVDVDQIDLTKPLPEVGLVHSPATTSPLVFSANAGRSESFG